MTEPVIVCVDDQREVLSSLVHDLESFRDKFTLLDCESAQEAREAIEELDAEGTPIALIISDHVMPGKTGVEFLAEVEADERFRLTRKLLLTGLATHEDTIAAINKARIDRYIAKPWAPEQLRETVSKLLTQFVFDADLEFRAYEPLLDPDTILERSR